MDTTLIGAGPHLDLIPRGAPRPGTLEITALDPARPGRAPSPDIHSNVYGKVSARTYIYA